MKNLKDNIWIEGFRDLANLAWDIVAEKSRGKEIYIGKTSSISEELAIKCVQYYFPFDGCYDKSFKNYEQNDHPFKSNSFCKTALESIQSACNQEYCIIFKK
jgi:hypothetical protein